MKDTPQQAISGMGGCPMGQDSCGNDNRNDMVNNYMDISHDLCRNAFTFGQEVRMRAVWAKYRGSV